MKNNKTKHERIHALLAAHKVEEFKGRHAYLHGMGLGREEYGVFWLRSDNATWGHTFGRMVGFNEMMYAHFGPRPSMGVGFAPVMDNMPPQPSEEDAGGLDGAPEAMARRRQRRTDRPTTYNEIYGNTLYGHDLMTTFGMSLHVLASPVIEVAEDGLSARSFYLTPGTMMFVNGAQGGRGGMWLWERYGSDFVYRDGKWWWFHEQVCPDFNGELDDENWAQDKFRKYIANTLEIGHMSTAPGSGISDERLAHSDISITQTVQDTVPDPMPYEKLDDEHSYSVGYNDFSGPLYPSNRSYGDYLY